MNPYQVLAWKLIRFPFKFFFRPQAHQLEEVLRAAAIHKRQGIGLLCVCNHVSAFDPFFVFAMMPLSCLKALGAPLFLAKRELFDRPCKRAVMERLGCLEVGDRLNVRNVIRRLRNGEVVFLFPEGCVSKNGCPGKDLGAARFFARYADFVLLPFRIKGIRGGFYRDWNNIVCRRRQFRMTVGQSLLVEKGRHPNLDTMALIRSIAMTEPQTAADEQPSLSDPIQPASAY